MKYIKRAAAMKQTMAADTTDGVLVSIRENAAFVKSIIPCSPPNAGQAAQQAVQAADQVLAATVPPADSIKKKTLADLGAARDQLVDAAKVWLLGKCDTLINNAPNDKARYERKELKKDVVGGSIEEPYRTIQRLDPVLAAAP